MTKHHFPTLDVDKYSITRDALHAYSRILGGWLMACRHPRKHWWHASLRPSLMGLTTGVIYAENMPFEIELNFRESVLLVCTAAGEPLKIRLEGQPATELALQVRGFLYDAGVSEVTSIAADATTKVDREMSFAGYSAVQANKLARALNAVNGSLVSFQASIREESSPIQLWPHHFDLAMLWLPGEKVADQDPDNEEHADKQMNFGFTFGDAGITEPYFYVTAYPLPNSFPNLALPAGTAWQSDGFSGAVLTYRRLVDEADPNAYLNRLWNDLLVAGRQHLISHSN